MPVGELTEEALAFVAYLVVDYVTTGGPASPTYAAEGAARSLRRDVHPNRRGGWGYAVGDMKAMLRHFVTHPNRGGTACQGYALRE
jgi:hypothetical protein